MPDREFDPIDMTGRWIGFYRYQDEEKGTFPITAEIRQERGRISGVMYDQITDRSELLDLIREANREEVSPSSKKQWQAMAERFGSSPVVAHSHLPEASDIDGKVAGGEVSFTKTYRGAMHLSWAVDGQTVDSVVRAQHQVHYSGQLDVGRKCLAGGWLIRKPGLWGRLFAPLATGTFELYQK